MALYKGSEIVAGLSKNTIVNGFHLFDFKWSDKRLNDISWLESSTFSWQDGNVYTTAYNKLVEEYASVANQPMLLISEKTEEVDTPTDDNSNSITETEDGITFIRSVNGFKIALPDQEQAILNKYNTDGIAWYYILDTANKRFKLPRTKFGFEGLRTNVGSDITESLPNIKGNWGNTTVHGAGNASSGAFYTNNQYSNYAAQVGNNAGTELFFDASRSSSTYQDGAPVQERGTQMYLYFYVGEYSREAIEQTAGINVEMFNGKADIDSVYNKVDVYTKTEINTKPQITAPYLKTTYVSGTSGYNIWSNGYCEQWGHTATNINATTITFLKSYSDTSYNVQLCDYYEGHSSGGSEVGPNIGSKTNGSIKITLVKNTNRSVDWQTSGYLAAGQY